MRSSRRILPLIVAVVGIIAAAPLAPSLASAESPPRLVEHDVDLAALLSFAFPDCNDLAEAADDALHEYGAAHDAMEIVCDIYGLFSGECVVATVYTAVQQYQYNQAVEAFLECWSA